MLFHEIANLLCGWLPGSQPSKRRLRRNAIWRYETCANLPIPRLILFLLFESAQVFPQHRYATSARASMQTAAQEEICSHIMKCCEAALLSSGRTLIPERVRKHSHDSSTDERLLVKTAINLNPQIFCFI